jgi:hypothetical protein
VCARARTRRSHGSNVNTSVHSTIRYLHALIHSTIPHSELNSLVPTHSLVISTTHSFIHSTTTHPLTHSTQLTSWREIAENMNLHFVAELGPQTEFALNIEPHYQGVAATILAVSISEFQRIRSVQQTATVKRGITTPVQYLTLDRFQGHPQRRGTCVSSLLPSLLSPYPCTLFLYALPLHTYTLSYIHTHSLSLNTHTLSTHSLTQLTHPFTYYTHSLTHSPTTHTRILSLSLNACHTPTPIYNELRTRQKHLLTN